MSVNPLELRSKKWQLTENNPEIDKVEFVKNLCGIAKATFCVGACEIGDNGTKHIHTFVVFVNAVKGSSLKKVFPRAHIEACRGSIKSNYDYVVKDDHNPYMVGELPLVEDVERASDVAAKVAYLIIENGLNPIEIMQQYPEYCEYIIRNFRNLVLVADYNFRTK